MEGRWEEAAEVNRQIVAQSPRDVDAHNRLGKALSEIGRLDEALAAYRAALGIDPGNMIARRNLERLEQSGAASGTEPSAAEPPLPGVRARVFIEEVGKTYVTDLVRPAGAGVLAHVAPADEVELRTEGNTVQVHDLLGNRLGQLEPRIARRLIALFAHGNRYKAYVVARTANTVRVILREVYRNPEAPEAVSFPRQAKIPAPRPYLREARSARELEPDLLLESEDEEDEEESEEEIDEGAGLDEEVEEDEDFIGEAEEEEEPPIAE